MDCKCLLFIEFCFVTIAFVNSFNKRTFTGNEFETVKINGTFNQTYREHVNSERRVYFIFNSSAITSENKNMAIRFELAAVIFDSLRPLMMVAERYFSISSWKIPIVIENSSYFNFTRTLCPEWNHNSSFNYEVFIFSTTSPNNISFLFIAYMEDIALSTSKDISITPSSPIYLFHEIAHDKESLIVKVESPNSSCAVISIQDSKCPINDMIGILENSRYFATMTKKGAITISKSSLRTSSFFVVLSMHPDNYDNCATAETIIPDQDGTIKKQLHIEIQESISNEKLVSAIVIGFSCFLLIYLMTFVSLAIYYYKFKSSYENQMLIERADDNEGNNLLGTTTSQENYGACSHDTMEEKDREIQDYEKVGLPTNYIWAKSHLSVSDMVKERRTLSKKQRTFFWDLVTVAIFYFLPVIQLVLNFQKTLNNTGYQDICYYNFYCISQVGPITAFNSFFSNIGYVMLGLLFLFLVYMRETSYMKLILRDERVIQYGIPQRYDLFYAVGLALIMEGLLSACYHICPSYNNFQFDTSFMYVIGWLCMLKIYQTRHQDMSLKAHVAYSIIAFVVLFGVVGITEGSLLFWVCFIIIYLLFIFYLSIHIYYLGRWTLNVGIFSRIFIRIKYEKSLLKPMYLDRLVLLVLGNLANWALAIYGASKMPSNFATYLLSIMLANFMMYFLFYFIMKIKYKEKIFITCFFFLFMAIVFWAFSLYFFFNQLVIWELSPALSREHNSDCLWMKFYDHHDIWHFLSALSLFFSFLVLLTMDDGLWNIPRNQIKVF